MSESENMEPTFISETKRPLVLVIDDDDAIRASLAELLDDAGFRTIDARHGLEALDILTTIEELPTFILLDLMMPVMDGWAFCDVRDKSGTLREIPIVCISAAPISRSERPAGIDAFMAKPIDLDNFVWLADRMAGRKRPGHPGTGALH
jgi:CheY-like chemotaxis protein